MVDFIKARVAADMLRAAREAKIRKDAVVRLANLEKTVAALSEELRNDLNAEVKIMDGEEIFDIPSSNVRRFTDTFDMEDDYGRKTLTRTASVEMIQFELTEGIIDRLDRNYRSDKPISWRGCRWQLSHLDTSDRGARSVNDSIGAIAVTAHLVAIAKSRK